jgi:hypothetical protein
MTSYSLRRLQELACTDMNGVATQSKRQRSRNLRTARQSAIQIAASGASLPTSSTTSAMELATRVGR